MFIVHTRHFYIHICKPDLVYFQGLFLAYCALYNWNQTWAKNVMLDLWSLPAFLPHLTLQIFYRGEDWGQGECKLEKRSWTIYF
jgi:hypothetical protein